MELALSTFNRMRFLGGDASDQFSKKPCSFSNGGCNANGGAARALTKKNARFLHSLLLRNAMDSKQHAAICLFVSVLSTVSLLVCANSVVDSPEMRDLVQSYIFSMVVSFSVLSYLDKSEAPLTERCLHTVGKEPVGKLFLGTSLWLPIVLSAFAITVVEYSPVNLGRVDWVVVALGYLSGQHAAKVFLLVLKRE